MTYKTRLGLIAIPCLPEEQRDSETFNAENAKANYPVIQAFVVLLSTLSGNKISQQFADDIVREAHDPVVFKGILKATIPEGLTDKELSTLFDDED